jgi:hypothetical protein
MRKLWYCGLEPYEGRYTLQLQNWSTATFDKLGIVYHVVPGDLLDTSKAISVGQVLDAHGRSFFALSQMQNLVKLMREGEVTGEDVIFFEDMFQPGFESLGYILNQIPKDQVPRIYVRCLAQTIDPDDFVHVWGMEKWMRHYEHMVNHIVDFSGGAVLATNEEMVAHMRIAGWTAPVYNIAGLAFSATEVRSRVNHVPKFADREKRVVFAARFDQEKQPHFFMDLIERGNLGVCKFVVLSGGPLKSNDPTALPRIRALQASGLVEIKENLSKHEYYTELAASRVLFNCALQDWVSNTVSEADALGCNAVYPAYRSFPETFNNDHTRLYVPWSLEDAEAKLRASLDAPHPSQGLIAHWNSGTVERCVDIMTGNGAYYNRSGGNYRSFVAQEK